MAILLHNNGYGNSSWLNALSQLMPNEDIVLLEDVKNTADKSDIEFALVWDFPLGELSSYPNLRAIFLLGAGTEHIDNEHTLPHVPVVRLIDPDVVRDMCAYSLYWVMHLQRNYDVYRQQQTQSHWQRYEYLPASEYKVTVLGLGQIGLKVADAIAKNGFKVGGWDKYPQQLDSIDCFHGDQQLKEALRDTHVLINCLPLTSDTNQFIDKQVLGLLPQGANLINISRGAVINDQDLLESLESKHINTAVLDAHSIEPLPESSPYWKHPQVIITPHVSGTTYARSAAKVVVANIERVKNAEQPFPLHIPPCHKQGKQIQANDQKDVS